MTTKGLELLKSGKAVSVVVNKKASIFTDFSVDLNDMTTVKIGIKEIDFKNKILYGVDDEAYDFDEIVSVDDGNPHFFGDLF